MKLNLGLWFTSKQKKILMIALIVAAVAGGRTGIGHEYVGHRL
jgi:hypothetical protein